MHYYGAIVQSSPLSTLPRRSTAAWEYLFVILPFALPNFNVIWRALPGAFISKPVLTLILLCHEIERPL
jgi:hypothetical protein